MKKHSVLLLAVLVLGGCTPLAQVEINPDEAPVSGALFTVPSSLSGSASGVAGSLRTPASDSLVAQSVEAYYNYARAQVAIGGEVAEFVRAFITAVEATGLIGKDLDANVYDQQDQVRHVWTSLGQNRYSLEKYVNVLTSEAVGNQQFEMNLAYRLEGGATEVSGDMTFDVSQVPDWPVAKTGEKAPDWVRVTFDSSKNGRAWMRLEVQGYRSFADIDPSVQNTVIELTKDASGEVTATSNSIVPGSRHFVWNGYTKTSGSEEVLNTGASSETRYYIFQGKATADDKATIQLAMAKGSYDEALVYTDFSIGNVLKTLFWERVVNNYDFNGVEAGGTGDEIIAALNVYADPDVSPTSTAQEILEALLDTQLALGTSPDTTIDYLVDIMQVSNPACFNALTYQSHGTPVLAGYPADLTDLQVITKAQVDTLNITF